MANTIGFNPATTGIKLMAGGQTDSLALDHDSLSHVLKLNENLNEFMEDNGTKTGNISKVVQEMKALMKEFGSPKTLRAQIVEDPNYLLNAGESSSYYAQIVSNVTHLGTFANYLVSTLSYLKKIELLDSDKKDSIINDMANNADEAKSKVAALSDSLKKFKTNTQDPMNKITTHVEAEGKSFQELNENIGRLNYKVERLNKEIEDLGWFTKKKRQSLESDLSDVEADLLASQEKATNQQKMLRKLESISSEAKWLDLGVQNIIDFLDNMNDTMKAFRASTTHLSVFAVKGEIQEPKPSWLESAVGIEEVSRIWNSISQASKKFIEQSIVD